MERMASGNISKGEVRFNERVLAGTELPREVFVRNKKIGVVDPGTRGNRQGSAAHFGTQIVEPGADRHPRRFDPLRGKAR